MDVNNFFSVSPYNYCQLSLHQYRQQERKEPSPPEVIEYNEESIINESQVLEKIQVPAKRSNTFQETNERAKRSRTLSEKQLFEENIDKLCKDAEIDKAIDLVNRSTDIEKDPYIFNSLLKACSKHKYSLVTVNKIIKMMKDCNIKKNDITFNILTNIYSYHNSLENAEKYFTKSISSSTSNFRFILIPMACMYSRLSNLPKLNNMLDLMNKINLYLFSQTAERFIKKFLNEKHTAEKIIRLVKTSDEGYALILKIFTDHYKCLPQNKEIIDNFPRQLDEYNWIILPIPANNLNEAVKWGNAITKISKSFLKLHLKRPDSMWKKYGRTSIEEVERQSQNDPSLKSLAVLLSVIESKIEQEPFHTYDYDIRIFKFEKNAFKEELRFGELGKKLILLYKQSGADHYDLLVKFSEVANNKKSQELILKNTYDSAIVLDSDGEGVVPMDQSPIARASDLKREEIFRIKQEPLPLKIQEPEYIIIDDEEEEVKIEPEIIEEEIEIKINPSMKEKIVSKEEESSGDGEMWWFDIDDLDLNLPVPDSIKKTYSF